MKSWVVMVGLLVGCSERTVGDDEDAAPMKPAVDVADVPAPEPEPVSDGSVMCSDGLAACEGACIDLMTDDENCGVCGHVCREPERFGHCEDGACPSALRCYPRNREPLGNCDDLCAAFGQRCDDAEPNSERGCSAEFLLYTNVTVPNGAIVDCEHHRDAYHTYGLCEDEIPWTWFPEGEVFSEAAACCCTQEPM